MQKIGKICSKLKIEISQQLFYVCVCANNLHGPMIKTCKKHKQNEQRFYLAAVTVNIWCVSVLFDTHTQPQCE